MNPGTGETVADVFADLLREAEAALRAVAKLSITHRSSRGILSPVEGFDFCNVCLMAALGAKPVEHLASCPVGVAASLADRIQSASCKPAPPCYASAIGRHIEYEDGREYPARIALHEEAAR